MATLIVKHTVDNYDSWKLVYDGADWLRKKHGIVSTSVHRSVENPNNMGITHRFRDMASLKAFMEELKPIMATAGLVGPPDLWVGEDVEHVKYS